MARAGVRARRSSCQDSARTGENGRLERHQCRAAAALAEVTLRTPRESGQAEYWPGNRSVTVKRGTGNLFVLLTNLHKGVGMGIGWALGALRGQPGRPLDCARRAEPERSVFCLRPCPNGSFRRCSTATKAPTTPSAITSTICGARLRRLRRSGPHRSVRNFVLQRSR